MSGVLAMVVGSVAIAAGAYSLYGLLGVHDDNRGVFSLLAFGYFLLGLGLPALAGGIVLITHPPTSSTQEVAVLRSALLVTGSLMLVAAALMTAAPVLGYTTERPNIVGMAILAGLGLPFVRSGRKRD